MVHSPTSAFASPWVVSDAQGSELAQGAAADGQRRAARCRAPRNPLLPSRNIDVHTDNRIAVGNAPERSHGSHFRHDVMRFFAEKVLERSYEQDPDRSNTDLFTFDPTARVIWRRSDILTPLTLRDRNSMWSELRPVASSFLRRVWQRRSGGPGMFRIPRLPLCGMVVHPRPYSLVIALRRPRCVWKWVHDESLRHLLDREREAARLAPTLAVPVLEWRPPGLGAPGGVKLGYALDTEPVSSEEFPDILQKIAPDLVSVYLASGVREVSVDLMLAEVSSSLEVMRRSQRTPLATTGAGLLARMLGVLEQHSARYRIRSTYRTFVHGDIQRSNFRRSRNRVALIDWSNGGQLNIMHDPFTIEFFAPTERVWRGVGHGGLVDTSRGFAGWMPQFLKQVAEILRIRLTPAEVTFGLLCSLAEEATKLPRALGGDETRALFWAARMEQLLFPASLAGAGET